MTSLCDLSPAQRKALIRISGPGDENTGEHRSLGWAESLSLNDLVVLALAEIRFDASDNRWYRLSSEGRELVSQMRDGSIHAGRKVHHG